MYKNHSEDILKALESVAEIKALTRGFPKSFEKLPCVAVSEASNEIWSSFDNIDYAGNAEYYVRIFSKGINDKIAEEVDRVLSEIGYARTFAYEDDNELVRQMVMRYRQIY